MLDEVALDERRSSGDELEYHSAEGIEIGASVGSLSSRLLGGNVFRSAAIKAARLVVGLDRLREPEVENLDAMFLGQQDVRGLDVPMHDAAIVCVLETLAGRDDEMHDFRDRQALFTFEDARIALAFDELHTDESAPVLDAEIVDGDDIRVVERGSRAGFLKKLIACGGIARELADLFEELGGLLRFTFFFIEVGAPTHFTGVDESSGRIDVMSASRKARAAFWSSPSFR